ncbi:ATP-binding protein [Streptodolium elevatio]|uniref:ATP-binding protein n=1 Tax=Streptodolium elevatio TaxID=3157996 RepID=A0ABV3DVY0_9ACTN
MRVRAFLKPFVEAGVVSAGVLRDVLLVAGELLSNALRHATGPYRFSVFVAVGGVTVAVRDRSHTLPREADSPAEAGGYGLQIVRRLTGGVRTVRHSDGKTVVATVPLSASD